MRTDSLQCGARMHHYSQLQSTIVHRRSHMYNVSQSAQYGSDFGVVPRGISPRSCRSSAHWMAKTTSQAPSPVSFAAYKRNTGCVTQL